MTLRVAIVEACEGVPQLVLVQASELVHRREMERALRESEQRVQDLVDNVDALIYIKSADGRYLLINRHFEEMFGVTPRGRARQARTTTSSRRRSRRVYTANDRRVLETGVPMEFEEPQVRATAAPGCRSSSRSSTTTAGPTPSAGISTDITDRKPRRGAVARRPRTRPSAPTGPRASSSRA